ncbi:hypothetical protein SRHO_G00201720 [Serrasalmus rhombeus]
MRAPSLDAPPDGSVSARRALVGRLCGRVHLHGRASAPIGSRGGRGLCRWVEPREQHGPVRQRVPNNKSADNPPEHRPGPPGPPGPPRSSVSARYPRRLAPCASASRASRASRPPVAVLVSDALKSVLLFSVDYAEGGGSAQPAAR